jgi:oxalate---CoA ligase
MSTLTTALSYNSRSPAIIIPEADLKISYHSLKRRIHSLQSRLASLGVSPHSAVTFSLINGLEFAICFLAVGAQRAIAAPLNPAYQQAEVEFYVDDIKAALLIVPRGAVEKDAPAVRAARKFGAGVAEIYWDGNQIQLDLKEMGKHLKPKEAVVKAEVDDIAVPTKFVTKLTVACIAYQWNNWTS